MERSRRNSKIVITTDGRTTLARLYEGKKVIRSAEAQCHPNDAFDFAIGARLAFDRLMEADKPAPEPAQEPVRLYCVKDYEPGEFLTKGKVYELKGTLEQGTLIYDDGWKDRFYRHYADHFGKNGPLKDYLVPLVKRQAQPGEWVYVHDRDGHTNGIGLFKVTGISSTHNCHDWVYLNGRHYNIVRGDEYLVLDGYLPELGREGGQ